MCNNVAKPDEALPVNSWLAARHVRISLEEASTRLADDNQAESYGCREGGEALAKPRHKPWLIEVAALVGDQLSRTEDVG